METPFTDILVKNLANKIQVVEQFVHHYKTMTKSASNKGQQLLAFRQLKKNALALAVLEMEYMMATTDRSYISASDLYPTLPQLV